MYSPKPTLAPSLTLFNFRDSPPAQKASERFAYCTWRDHEIVRLELSITRSVASRSRLLRLRRTVEVDGLLFVNERDLLRLGSALATLTRVPFVLLDVLSAAANSAPFDPPAILEQPA